MVPIVATTLLTGLLLWEALDLNKALKWVDHTDIIIDQSENLLTLIVDMESGTRGYIVTGNDKFLQPYGEAAQRIEPDYRALYLLVDANQTQQQQELKDFHAGYLEWSAYAGKIIELKRMNKSNPTFYENQQGKVKMDDLRTRILTFQNSEIQLRKERVAASQLRWYLMLGSFLVLGVGFGVGIALYTRYNVKKLGDRLLHSEQQWTATLGSIGEAVIATDVDGRVTFLNPIASALTGWSQKEALERPIGDVFKIVNEKTGRSADDEVVHVLKEGVIISVSNHVALITRDGREIPVDHSAAPILALEGKVIGVVLVFRDVAERRERQIELAEQAALLELTQDAVFVADIGGTILFWSHGAEAMLGYTKEEAVGKLARDLAHMEFPQSRDFIKEELQLVGHWEGDVTAIAKDGRRIVMASRWALQWGKRGMEPRVLMINNDITVRIRNEEALVLQREQLRALAERLQLVREEDRKRVARDLHDEIGQILTSIKMDLTWMTRHLSETEVEIMARLEESIQLLNDGVKTVRAICSRLRPGVLDDLGLAAAIEWQSSEFASRNGVQCQVTVPPVDMRLNGDRATATFRIFQECLTNVTRHAQAKTVRVTLQQEEESILLVVEDDGIGFEDSGFSTTHGSLGLLGMKERAQFCGGDVHISSTPGKGTTVTVRVPLDIPQSEKVMI